MTAASVTATELFESVAARHSAALTADALALGLAHGTGMFPQPDVLPTNSDGTPNPEATPDAGRKKAKFLNYSLTPHPFPRAVYKELFDVATPVHQLLLDEMCCDMEAFLLPALEGSSAEADEITRELIAICRSVYLGKSGARREFRDEVGTISLYFCETIS